MSGLPLFGKDCKFARVVSKKAERSIKQENGDATA
jgi:hypothetical protein